jgi:iron(III) transport system substrate-binding protein
LQDIEQLAEPEWQGRVCTRKGSHVYNRALLASLIAHHGEEDARAWAKGLVGNLARRPQGNDRAQAKAIYAGECDVALMNTYYFGKMKFNKSEPEQRVWADSIELVFFNQQGRGQHVNISAGGILKTSKNKDRARAFLAWLTSAEAQRLYTEINYEYPVNPASAPSDEVASWGSFKMDKLALPEIARLSPVAQRIINSTGW